jgi:hypothetical protein
VESFQADPSYHLAAVCYRWSGVGYGIFLFFADRIYDFLQAEEKATPLSRREEPDRRLAVLANDGKAQEDSGWMT